MTMKIHYFNSSHWDREWYQPFQHFRMYLTAMSAELLRTLENDPAFSFFVFDGQTAILEDILEIYPEWRKRLENQISSGRLRVGPWYVQPDEFLVSGEALIMNLEFGHRIAREFGGKAWPFGYLCDTFGHIAQMPQILRGFGIETAGVWRGVPPDIGSFFRWIAPDGSECLTARLPEFQGYGDFSGQVTGFWNDPLKEDEFKTKAKTYIDRLRREPGPPLLLLLDGVDHAPVHASAPQYVQWIRELYPDAEVVFSDFSGLADDLAPVRNQLRAVGGELVSTTRRQGGFSHLISHTLSSHYPLKQANDECQTELELHLSPLLAWAALHGHPLESRLLDTAWKYLLQNHAHDSICGCSVDQVHRDMVYRFDQVHEICDALRSEFLVCDRNRYTGSDVRKECHPISGGVVSILPNGKNGMLALRFFNPLPYECECVRNFEVVFPCEYTETYAEPFGYETINSFVLRDASGNPVPYGITSIERSKVKRFYRYDARQYDCYRITAMLKLRAFGWTTYSVEPSPKPVRCFRGLSEAPCRAENALLRVEIQSDGTLTVTDKRSGRIYPGLNRFIADAEIGDGWNHVVPKGAPVTFSSGVNAIIRMTEDSPDRAAFEIEQMLVVPEGLVYKGTLQEKYAGISASEKNIGLRISTFVSLDTDSPLLRFRTVVENHAGDYRLRLHVPTGISGEYFAHQAFCFLTRPAGRATGETTADWKEPEPLEKNFGELAGKRDEKGGIALLSGGGLHEISALEGKDGELLFTLLRSFRRTVATNGEKQCLLQGKLEYRYALYFLTPEESAGELYRQGQIYRVEPDHYTVSAHQGVPCSDESLVRIESRDTAVSLIRYTFRDKNPELLIRMVNFSQAESVVELLFPSRPKRGEYVTIGGMSIKEADIGDSRLRVKIPGNGITTLKIEI